MAFAGTPQRPLPGAFFNTPAPSRYNMNQPSIRQPSFQQPASKSAGPSSNGQQASASHVLQAPVQAPIQRAAGTINSVLDREASFPELDSYVKQGISSQYDLPNTTTESAWAPFVRTNLFEIPEKIFEQYNHAVVSTKMGLFAELNHAWVAIDNCLYMWDYTNPNPEIIGFEEQPNNITAIRLAVPRAGVFVQDITHLLVVATTADIILLGVASKLENIGGALSSRVESTGVISVQLYQTRMSLSIKGINVEVIEGSKATGRIFFAGKEENEVYELTYQQEEKWFASRCGKVNHTAVGYGSLVPAFLAGHKTKESVKQMVVDDSRRLLYTLSSQSTVRVFYMDSPATLTQVIEKKRNDFLRDISHMMSQSALLTPTMEICTISPISSREGSRLSLMATTNTGCRLFLSATRGAYGYSGQGAPHSMQVQHIKFPPRIDEGRLPQSQSQQLQSYSANNQPATDTSSKALSYARIGLRVPPGLFFAFIAKTENSGQDSLFVSGPDTGRIGMQANSLTNEYFEVATWLPLDSRAEDVGVITKPFAAAQQPRGFGNELATQFDEAPQEIAILTNTGVHIIRRKRLVDTFAAAIRRQGGEEGLDSEVKKFIRNYGRAETTATALAVACGQGNDGTPGDTRISRISDPETLELARKCFVEFGGRPTMNENAVQVDNAQAIDFVQPSSRHAGLATYMARLIRSVWKASVITQKLPAAGGGLMEILSTVPLSKLALVQDDLTRLATFLDKNKSFIEGLAGPDQRGASRQEDIALQGEHQALHSLQKLNSSIIEGISFVQMLFDERVEEIWAALDDTARQRLRNLTYEILFSSDQGKDLAKVLVKAIVNRNIANGSNIDTVADALRRRCGSFCSADDVVIFKAQEQLKKASEVGANSDMGRKLLNESLKLFQQVASSLSYENLATAAEQFTSLQFYAGAISLSLLVAHESDRGNRALSWVNENRPDSDPRAPLFEFRKRCYDLIHQILAAVDAATSAEQEMIDGRLTLAATKRNEAHAVVNDSDDELFQFDLYEWYLSQGWVDMLLQVESDFVVQFLTKSAINSVDRADLLWKYHVHNENFYEAAMVQLELAKSEFPITLAKRIEYLSRAKANASAQSIGIGRQARQVLVYEITELLDVANIQDEILHRLRDDDRLGDRKESVLGQLDGQVMGLSELYNGFADQASYFDICITIYAAAGHRNEADINATWQSLLEKTHHDAEADPNGPQPYEAVITVVRQMAQRLGNDENSFSPRVLIPIVEKYAFEYQQNQGPDNWVPQLFLEVGVSHETIVSVIQSMWFNNVLPFTENRKQILSHHILFVLNEWCEECVRTNSRLYGTDSNAEMILELLQHLSASNLARGDVEVCELLKRKINRAIG